MRHSRVFVTPDGRVACQGPTLMTGYVGDPEKTAEVLHDDTLFTADNGEINADGMLFLMGRNDDVINIGGLKVAPTEVEDIALRFPSVKECACIPFENGTMGKCLKMLVVVADGCSLDRYALTGFMEERLEQYKIPKLFEEVEEIPKTFNGKIDRKKLLTL